MLGVWGNYWGGRVPPVPPMIAAPAPGTSDFRGYRGRETAPWRAIKHWYHYYTNIRSYQLQVLNSNGCKTHNYNCQTTFECAKLTYGKVEFENFPRLKLLHLLTMRGGGELLENLIHCFTFGPLACLSQACLVRELKYRTSRAQGGRAACNARAAFDRTKIKNSLKWRQKTGFNILHRSDNLTKFWNYFFA